MTWTKEKQKEYMREYNIKNRAKLKEAKKQQIANNPEYAAFFATFKESLERCK